MNQPDQGTRLCTKCRQKMPITAFGLRAGRGTPYSRCRDCCRQASREHRATPEGKAQERRYRATDSCREKQRRADAKRSGTEHRRAQARALVAAYRRTEHGKRKSAESNAERAAREPEKFAARVALGIAVAHGRVVPGPCAVCGSKKGHGHHVDYAKPLDVVWLCPLHHKHVHMGRIEVSR